MHLDSLIALLLISATALLFTVSVFHKLSAPRHFVAVLADYQLTPQALAQPMAGIVIIAEVCVVVFALSGARSVSGLLAAALLILYSLAVGTNIIRGRRDIDCGCAGPAASQTISGWLIIRNIGLAMMALAALLPANSRQLDIADWATLGIGLSALCGLYAAINTLIANQLRLTSDKESRLWKTR